MADAGAATTGDASTWERRVVTAAIAYFALRLVDLALRLDASIPPDEVTHVARVLYYARWLGPPGDGPDSHALGLISHRPYLYYYLLGKLVSLNPFASDLLFLRLVNVVFGVLLALVGYRWIALVSPDPWVRTLFVVLLTNTPMLSFLAASVSYDNLVNLLAAASLYLLFRFARSRAPADLAVFLLAVGLGGLTERKFLPLGFALVVALLVRERERLPSLAGALRQVFSPPRPGRLALFALAGAALLLNLQLYGENLLRFGSLAPDPVDVLGEQSALRYRVTARDQAVRGYRAGEISLEAAVAIANRIEQPGDRAAALSLLAQGQAERSQGSAPRMDRWLYAAHWSHEVAAQALGVVGHRQLRKSPGLLSLYFALGLGATLLFARRWRPGDWGGLAGWAALAVVFHALIVMQGISYARYQEMGAPWLLLQGRYVFPVLVPFYGLAVSYGLAGWRPPVRHALWLVAAALFTAGDFPYFLAYAGPEWFHAAGP